MNLWLRIMIGGFLVYQAYSIGIGLKNTTGNDTLILGAAVVLFALAGGVIVVWSVYRLIKRDYYDPILDDDSDDDSEQDSE